MQDEPFVYRPPVVALGTHLRRYPVHYGVLVLFLLATALLPTLTDGNSALPFSSSTPLSGIGSPAAAPTTGSDAPSIAAGPTSLPSIGASTPSGGGGSSSTAGLGSVNDLADESTSSTPATPGTPAGPAPRPSPPGGAELPSLPGVPLPPAPEEAKPLLAAVGPLANTGCSAVGLAGVVVAVVGPSAPPEVPVADLLSYIAPAYQACAYFPPPSSEPLICDIDQQMRDAGYPADVSGLAKTPNVVGMGVEVLYGIESAIEAYTGTNPGMVDAIAAQLGCQPDAG